MPWCLRNQRRTRPGSIDLSRRSESVHFLDGSFSTTSSRPSSQSGSCHSAVVVCIFDRVGSRPAGPRENRRRTRRSLDRASWPGNWGGRKCRWSGTAVMKNSVVGTVPIYQGGVHFVRRRQGVRDHDRTLLPVQLPFLPKTERRIRAAWMSLPNCRDPAIGCTICGSSALGQGTVWWA